MRIVVGWLIRCIHIKAMTRRRCGVRNVGNMMTMNGIFLGAKVRRLVKIHIRAVAMQVKGNHKDRQRGR